MTKPTNVYLAGRMSGIGNFNQEAFDEAEKTLKVLRIKSVNPASLDATGLPDGVSEEAISRGVVTPRDRALFLRRDLKIILDECDGIVMLPGWQHSHGANVELAVAMSVGLRTFEYVGHTPKTPLNETLLMVDHGVLVAHWMGLYF